MWGFVSFPTKPHTIENLVRFAYYLCIVSCTIFDTREGFVHLMIHVYNWFQQHKQKFYTHLAQEISLSVLWQC